LRAGASTPIYSQLRGTSSRNWKRNAAAELPGSRLVRARKGTDSCLRLRIPHCLESCGGWRPSLGHILRRAQLNLVHGFQVSQRGRSNPAERLHGCHACSPAHLASDMQGNILSVSSMLTWSYGWIRWAPRAASEGWAVHPVICTIRRGWRATQEVGSGSPMQESTDSDLQSGGDRASTPHSFSGNNEFQWPGGLCNLAVTPYSWRHAGYCVYRIYLDACAKHSVTGGVSGPAKSVIPTLSAGRD